MRSAAPRSIKGVPLKSTKNINVILPHHIHARYKQECKRVAALNGWTSCSFAMLFIHMGNQLPPTPQELGARRPPTSANLDIRCEPHQQPRARRKSA
jgi:hypothetical protein